jgi:hypothetical protein
MHDALGIVVVEQSRDVARPSPPSRSSTLAG